MANAPQNIWKKEEKGYLIVDYYSADDKGHTKVKMGDQIFNGESIIIKAPQEKGLHKIKGQYFIKEAGIEVARPFFYRVLVE